MSRTKEGFENESSQPGQAQSPGKRSQGEEPDRSRSSYYSGRESWREFPRRSTANRSGEPPVLGAQSPDRYNRAEQYSRSTQDYNAERGDERYQSRVEPRRDQQERYLRDQSQGRHSGRLENRDADYQYRSEGAVPYDRVDADEGYRDDRGRDVFHWQRPGAGRPNARYEEPYDNAGVRQVYRTEPAVDRGSAKSPLRCRDLMTRDVTTCLPSSTIRQVAEKMEDEDVGSIPIVEDGRLIGIITDRDIVCRVLAEELDTASATAIEAGSKELITATPDEPVREALHKMSEYQIRRLPIVDLRGRLVGMVSLGDIALEAEYDHELTRGLQQISRPLPSGSRRK
jgi:CBS domain-containing protein